MPTTVENAFSGAGLWRHGVVRWGENPETTASGVYIVALTESQTSLNQASLQPRLCRATVDSWLSRCPELRLDGNRPTTDELMDGIGQFWLTDEVIVYIGLASNLRSRLSQYYRTPIGARAPHSGGYFLKLLARLEQLWVHYALCDEPRTAESSMLGRFVSNVSAKTRTGLGDPAHPFPFANLEWPQGVRKQHGLRGVREPKTSAAKTDIKSQPKAPTMSTRRPPLPENCRTQRVTSADLKGKRIRIPSSGAASTKRLFPDGETDISIILKGQAVTGAWDPKMGTDKERSGVFRVRDDFADALHRLVSENEVLTVRVDEGGVLRID